MILRMCVGLRLLPLIPYSRCSDRISKQPHMLATPHSGRLPLKTWLQIK